MGRVPVVVTLDLLDREALERILTEPKNAITRQYKKLLEMDGVSLEFTPEAIGEIAVRSQERKTGARGLRSIMEKIMQNVMYEIPSDDNIGKCLITKEVVDGTGEPELTYRTDLVEAAEDPTSA